MAGLEIAAHLCIEHANDEIGDLGQAVLEIGIDPARQVKIDGALRQVFTRKLGLQNKLGKLDKLRVQVGLDICMQDDIRLLPRDRRPLDPRTQIKRRKRIVSGGAIMIDSAFYFDRAADTQLTGFSPKR